MGAREDIEMLDSKVARLKVEYEQYFMRLVKREPAKLRDEVEKLVLLYSNKNISNTSLKFRYNSIVSKYNSYKQYWNRTLRAIEEGTYVRKAEGAPELAPTQPGQAVRPAPGAAEKARTERPSPERDNALEQVYRQYIEARKECNEPVKGITYESIAKTVEQARKKAEEMYSAKEVDLKVYIKDGKAKLAITPKGK